MVLLDAGKLHDTRFVSLWKLDALRGIELSPTWIDLGALTTYSGIIADDRLAAEFPLLRLAALETGGIATQNRGTIGGNIANASPAADTPPALLVYDAELELASVRGVRRLPYASFHTGYKKMDLAPDEVIAAIRLPRGRRWTRAAVPQGRHAPRAGDLEGLLRGGDRRRGRTRVGRQAGLRQRGSDVRARHGRRGVACEAARSMPAPSPRPAPRWRTTSRRSTTCDRPPAIASPSRRTCWRSSSPVLRWRDRASGRRTVSPEPRTGICYTPQADFPYNECAECMSRRSTCC